VNSQDGSTHIVTDILIVEDSPTQALQLRYILEQHSYHVSVASNGRDALASMHQHRPAIVISDVLMPEMDGYQLCRRIKADTNLADIPVILLTSLSDPKDVIKGLECGADNFIVKPYDKDFLLSRIQYISANQRLRRVEKTQMGLEIFFAGQTYFIASDRLQILNLLLSTYETAVQKNRALIDAQETLQQLNARLEEIVAERTAALTAEIAERTRAEEALRRYAERLRILQEIDRAILAAQSPVAMAQAALGHIYNLIPCWWAGISLIDWQTRQSVVFASVSRGTPRFPVGARLPLDDVVDETDLALLRSGQVRLVNDTRTLTSPSTTVRALRVEGLRSYVRVPLVARDELIGLLNLWSDQVNAFTAEPLDIAHEVANQLAVGIQQARLYEQVQRHAADLEERVAERTAELRDINSELESFSYSVSHDLRTPLRSIQGFAQILQEEYGDRLEAAGTDYLQRIVAASRRMDMLTEDLLAYSRLSRTAVELIAVDLEGVIADALAQLEAEIRRQEAQVIVERPLPHVAAHYVTLVQAVMNLLGNALKFVPADVRPRIRVWAEEQDDRICLRFRDNGIGIAPEYQERIFRIFERLHGSGAYPGTGIGLSIVRKGVERMGGRVGVESAPGQGSTFWIELHRPSPPPSP
jgi:signal transduction histidine kinase/DNA-binding response OmpR family regulator